MLGEHQVEVCGFRCQMTSVSGVCNSVTLVYSKHWMSLVIEILIKISYLETNVAHDNEIEKLSIKKKTAVSMLMFYYYYFL